MFTIRSIGLVLMSGMAFGLGCQLIAGVNTDATYAENGGSGVGTATATNSSSSTTSSSSGGGSGGSGGSPECTMLSDCIAGECKTATACNNGACVWNYAAYGLLTSSQLYGDCLDRVCDGLGGIKSVPGDLDKDAYNWGNSCFVPTCDIAVMPLPIPMPKADGEMCRTAWSDTVGTCKDAKCIECIGGDCGPMKVCIQGRCRQNACANMVQDGFETDVDCGGTHCPSCSAGFMCIANTDCTEKCDTAAMPPVCVSPSPPLCNDAVRNADETDVDCGGSCAKEMQPKKCADFKNCLFPDDCQSGVCKIGVCYEATCTDYVKNRDEVGIDCGGATCLPCPPKP